MWWFQRLLALFRKRQLDERIDEELRFHIDMQTEENTRRGMSPAEARRVALRDSGGVEQIKEEHRDQRGIRWLETLWRDVRYGARSLARNPGLTTVAVLTLALGMGANTSIFTIMKAVVLAPLPYPDHGRLMRVWPELPVNTEFFVHYREVTEAFEAISICQPSQFALSGEGRPEEIAGALITPEHFTVMGVQPFLGRGFARDETDSGKSGVAVLSFGLWQRLFGGQQDAIGKILTLSGREYTVVGVMPSHYRPLETDSRLWVPLEIDPSDEMHWDWITYRLLGRLAPGVSVEQSVEDLRRAISTYVEIRPTFFAIAKETAGVVPLHEHTVSGSRNTFRLLAGGVFLVLLVACANVANLLLAKVSRQRSELALRNALGAGTARLVSQVLVQSLLLAVVGGVAGLLVARLSLTVLEGILPPQMPRIDEIVLDLTVLGVTFGLTVLAGLVLGVLPALRAARIAPGSDLNAGTRGAAAHHHRFSHALIAAEVAVAAALVVGTGLLVKSFDNLQRVDTGFSGADVLAMQLKPPSATYTGEAARRRYFESVVERVRAVRGVESAAVINRLPMTPGDIRLSAFMPSDREMPPNMKSVSVRLVSPGFLDTLGIELIRGRPIEATDRADTPAVGLINQAMAKRIWEDDDPVGARLVFDTGEPWFTVIGVVADIRQHSLDEASQPQVYRPVAQSAWEERMALVVRTTPGRQSPIAEIERAIWSVDPNVPITGQTTMHDVIRRSLGHPRMMAALFSLFGFIALSLGLAGVFGVTAYAVAQRTRENGVRVALGAKTGDVVRASLWRTMRPVMVGLVFGCAASFWLTRFLGAFLFGVQPTDPAVFAAVAALLLICTLGASYLPARRAAKVDPMVALRHE